MQIHQVILDIPVPKLEETIISEQVIQITITEIQIQQISPIQQIQIQEMVEILLINLAQIISMETEIKGAEEQIT